MIAKGTLVCRSKPFTYIIADSCRGYYCDFCVKRNNNLRKCTQCSYTYYCDRKCQRKAWKDGHKHECLNIKNFMAVNEFLDCYMILLTRAIYKLKFGGNEQEVVCDVTRRFQDLESHVDNIRNDAFRLKDFSQMVEGLKDLLPPDDLPPFNELLEIYGKVQINGNYIRNDEFCEIGGAVYLGTSIFNHSCKPNAVRVNDGAESCVYLIEDIPVLDHSKIFVSYMNLHMTTEERRRVLKMGYYFDCNCVRCLDVHNDQLLNSIKCTNENCDAPVLVAAVGPTSCLKCGTNLSSQSIKSALAAMDLCKKSYHKFNPKINCHDIIEECEKILEISEPVLHPENIHLFRIAYIACDSMTLKYDAFWRAFQLIDHIVLQFLKKTENNYCPSTGIFLLKMAKRAQLIDDDFFIRQYLEEAFEILGVTRGVSREGLMPYRLMMEMVDSSFEPNFSD